MAVALELAVIHNDASIVETLISQLDSNIINEHSLALGRTLLHVAVRNDNLTIARMLLQRGADVNASSDDNLAALHIAIGNRSTAMLELLLQFDADVNHRKKFNGKTPLYMAVEYNCVEIAEMLLKKGARTEDATINGAGVLHLALRIRSERMAKILMHHVTKDEVNARSQLDGKTPLQLAVENGQCEIVRELVKKGADVNESYVSKHTDENENENVDEVRSPLSIAVRRGDDKTVALLLRCGAKNLANACLHQAVKLRCKKIADLLLRNEVAQLEQQLDGKTALQLAVECGYKDMIKVCLTHGASLDNLGDKKVTLLYGAVKSNDSELVELLLKNGAPVNEFVCKNVRLIDVAIKARFVTMTKLLLKHGALINDKSSHEEKIFGLKYAVLLLAEGHKIERENRKLIRSDNEWSAFYEKCRAELKRSKSDRIVGELTFFDVLTGNDDSLASYARREQLVEAFPSSGYRRKYDVYADTLALNYAKGRLRNALLQKATADFEQEFGMPLDSARNVFRLMSNEDLKAFIKSFCECKHGHHTCLPHIFIEF